MLIQFTENGKTYTADLALPLDISLGFPTTDAAGTTCFWAAPFAYEPEHGKNWVGLVREGFPVNFLNVRFNPHGNGTHTECVGHIAPEIYSVNNSLQSFHFLAHLLSLYPQRLENGDRVITMSQIKEILDVLPATRALLLRTLPNDDFKRTTNYSGSNPPYVEPDALSFLRDWGVEHLLLDLPSVDKEDDGGLLLAHKAFWHYPEKTRHHATITELIYVPNSIKDGLYLLNLQIAPFPIDAAPSKPVLYALRTV